MSAKIMGAVFDLDLPAPKLLVLLAMADHADHDGRNIYPSIGRIGWKCGYSESQTRRIIKSLVRDGILERVDRSGRTALFNIHLEAGKKKQPYGSEWNPLQNDTPTIAMTPHPYHSYDTPTPTIAMTPEPSFEPSINQIQEKDSTSDDVGNADKTSDSKANSPLKEKKKVIRQPTVRQPNPLFDAVASEVFGIDPAHITGEGGRIGQIAHWLAGIYEGKGENRVGRISAPAKPEHVTAFVAHWKKNNDPKYIRVIQNFVHFVEAWRAWASSKQTIAANGQTNKPKTYTRVEPDWDVLAAHEEKRRARMDPEARALLEKLEKEAGYRYGIKIEDAA